jgi:hypothetical protein
MEMVSLPPAFARYAWLPIGYYLFMSKHTNPRFVCHIKTTLRVY